MARPIIELQKLPVAGESGFAAGVTTSALVGTIANTNLPSFTAYTPTLTGSVSNPNIGSTGTAVGSYIQIGELVVARVAITFGGSGISAGSGDYRVSIPVAAATTINHLGSGYHYDASGGASAYTNPVVATVGSTSLNVTMIYGAAGNVVGASNPVAPATGDMIVLNLTYEAA